MQHRCNLAAKESGLECTCLKNDDFIILVNGAVVWACVYYVAAAFQMTEQEEQWIYIKFYIKLEHSSVETIQMIQKAEAMGNW